MEEFLDAVAAYLEDGNDLLAREARIMDIIEHNHLVIIQSLHSVSSSDIDPKVIFIILTCLKRYADQLSDMYPEALTEILPTLQLLLYNDIDFISRISASTISTILITLKSEEHICTLQSCLLDNMKIDEGCSDSSFAKSAYCLRVLYEDLLSNNIMTNIESIRKCSDFLISILSNTNSYAKIKSIIEVFYFINPSIFILYEDEGLIFQILIQLTKIYDLKETIYRFWAISFEDNLYLNMEELKSLLEIINEDLHHIEIESLLIIIIDCLQEIVMSESCDLFNDFFPQICKLFIDFFKNEANDYSDLIGYIENLILILCRKSDRDIVNNYLTDLIINDLNNPTTQTQCLLAIFMRGLFMIQCFDMSELLPHFFIDQSEICIKYGLKCAEQLLKYQPENPVFHEIIEYVVFYNQFELLSQIANNDSDLAQQLFYHYVGELSFNFSYDIADFLIRICKLNSFNEPISRFCQSLIAIFENNDELNEKKKISELLAISYFKNNGDIDSETTSCLYEIFLETDNILGLSRFVAYTPEILNIVVIKITTEFELYKDNIYGIMISIIDLLKDPTITYTILKTLYEQISNESQISIWRDLFSIYLKMLQICHINDLAQISIIYESIIRFLDVFGPGYEILDIYYTIGMLLIMLLNFGGVDTNKVGTILGHIKERIEEEIENEPSLIEDQAFLYENMICAPSIDRIDFQPSKLLCSIS